MKVAFEKGRLSRRLLYLVIAIAVDRFGSENLEQHGQLSFDLQLVNESDYALIMLHDIGTDRSAGQFTTIAGLDANRTLGIAEDAEWNRDINERCPQIHITCYKLTRNDLRRACEHERALRPAADSANAPTHQTAPAPRPRENANRLAPQFSTVK